VAEAKTEVKAKIEQLQNNVKASQSNLEQYQSNLKIVNQNLAETDRAIKALDAQKRALASSSTTSGKDKVSVEERRKQVMGALQAERDALATEDRQIEELKAALQRLEDQRVHRREVIAAHEQRLQLVDQDQEAWAERDQSIAQLSTSIDSKRAEAVSERQRLQAKKADYESEVEKWKQQIRFNERAHRNFSKLK
jgi:chromosome segregation ATPase